ncbi:MAG: HAMP domain-containing sensor histidine kinase [bacterium]
MNKVLRHRLRNFASGIKNAVSLLEEENRDVLPPESREYFPLIQGECDQLHVLTERLSMMFDPACPVRVAARTDVQPQPLDGIVRKVLEEIRRTFPAAEVDVAAEDEVRSKLIAGGTALVLALVEMVGNAIEAARNKPVLLQCEEQGGELACRVVDQGPGVGSGDPAQILLPFHTTRGKHTGIGLTLAVEVLAEHGGRLSVARNTSGGLTVTAHLPFQKRGAS